MEVPATNTTPPPATTTTAPAATSWVDGLGPELKSYVETKGIKEPKDLAESYRNLEKIHGLPESRLLKLPESLESEEMAPIWERLGKPKAASEYKIESPKEFSDQKLADWAKETALSLNMPRAMAEKFMDGMFNRQKTMLAEGLENRIAQVKNEEVALKKEWGQAFEQNESIANQTAVKFGLTKEEIQTLGASLGPSKALKLLHKLGEGMGEAPFISGGGGNPNHLTPIQAQTQIKDLIQDADFSRRLSAKDADAVAKWNRLHQFAHPGELTI